MLQELNTKESKIPIMSFEIKYIMQRSFIFTTEIQCTLCLRNLVVFIADCRIVGVDTPELRTRNENEKNWDIK